MPQVILHYEAIFLIILHISTYRRYYENKSEHFESRPAASAVTASQSVNRWQP